MPVLSSAVFWGAEVRAGEDSWSIHRYSGTVGFDLQDFVTGNVSSIGITPDGRSLVGYHSRRIDVDVNDVCLKEMTSAQEGVIASGEIIFLRSEALESVTREQSKPVGSNITTIEYQEIWPVGLQSSRAISYSGSEINDRDFAGNNLDYVGTSFLYNNEFSMARDCYLRLYNMNATIVGINESVDGGYEERLIKTEFLPTKNSVYQLASHSDGIASLKYKQVASDMVTPLGEGEQRFYGTYNLSTTVQMGSEYVNLEPEEYWLTCCFGDDLEGKSGQLWQSFPLDGLDAFICPIPEPCPPAF